MRKNNSNVDIVFASKNRLESVGLRQKSNKQIDRIAEIKLLKGEIRGGNLNKELY
jgi:hypothetical protein